MGTGGTVYSLAYIEDHQGDRGDPAACFEETVDFAWRYFLSSDDQSTASGWIHSLDPLAWFEAEVDSEGATVTLWLYDSVDWPIDLANHWLSLALGAMRIDLETDLKRAGFRLTVQIPDMRHFYDGPWFGAVGTAPDEMRALDRDAARAQARCACSFCEALRWRMIIDEAPSSNLRISAAAAWAYGDFGGPERFHRTRDGSRLVVLSDDESLHVLRSGSHGDPWRQVATSRGRSFAQARPDGRLTIVIQLKTSDSLVLLVCDDTGTVWERHSPLGLPSVPRLEIFPLRDPGLEMLAIASGPDGSSVLRSDDGGISFHTVCPVLSVDGVQVLHCDDASAAREDVSCLYLLSDRGMLVSRDGGASWIKPVSTLRYEDGEERSCEELCERILVGRDGQRLACFEGADAMCSRDGGETWSLLPYAVSDPCRVIRTRSGLWFWVQHNDELLYSSDEGEHWSTFGIRANAIFEDGHDPDTFWVCRRWAIARVERISDA